jgi:twinkle protein
MRTEPGEEEPVPTLWDISGSANWRNKADFGMTVWRNPMFPEDPIRVYINKVRFSETGEVGMTPFAFTRSVGQYREFAQT